MGTEAEVETPTIIRFNRRGRRIEKNPNKEDATRALNSTRQSIAAVIDGLQTLRELLPEGVWEADKGIVLAHDIDRLLDDLNDHRVPKVDK